MNEFAQGLSTLKCQELLNMQINLALSHLFADVNGQIVLEQFVWAVAKPMLQKLLAPLAVELCAVFVKCLCLPSDGRINRMSINRTEAFNVLGEIMKRGGMNEIHIRFSAIFLEDQNFVL